MSVVRRRLFWKIYITLLGSLIAAILFMGAFFWFLDETQREGASPGPGEHAAASTGPGDVTLFAADGTMVGARGRAIAPSEDTGRRPWGQNAVRRIDLPGGGYALTRFEPPARGRAIRMLAIMLVVFGGVGLAAYPVTALLTRRLEVLRAAMAQWGDGPHAIRLDESGSDEVALLARTFNTASARIDTMLAAQKTLLANASHELRSPLARLRVAIDVGPLAEATPSRGEIVQNLAEMDQLVDELLLASWLDHHGSHPAPRDTIDVLGLAAEEAARHHVVVTGEPVEIVGDAVLLRRLIRNLLENAVKHGRAPIFLSVARRDGDAEIVVDDCGRGVAAEDRRRIFEPFYRPAGSGEATGGWGLGLALVRQIAERHGGSVACHDAPSGGSRFVVRLPTS